MIPVKRLNHAVLYVRDLDVSVDFYTKAFAFEEIAREGGMMAFLRAEGSENRHDLGLLALGPDAPRPPRGSTGLYHLAWQVDSIEDLVTARDAPDTGRARRRIRSRRHQVHLRQGPGRQRIRGHVDAAARPVVRARGECRRRAAGPGGGAEEVRQEAAG